MKPYWHILMHCGWQRMNRYPAGVTIVLAPGYTQRKTAKALRPQRMKTFLGVPCEFTVERNGHE